MKNLLKELFSGTGTISSMRVMAFISLITACVIAIWGLIDNRDLSAVAVLCTTFLASAFGGKALQSFGENKDNGAPK